MATADEFARVMSDVALRLIDQRTKNLAQSSATEWRYGTRGSLSIDIEKGIWNDHDGSGQVVTGGGVLDLICRVKTCDRDHAKQWLREQGLWQSNHQHREVAHYNYPDENRVVLYQMVRFEPKDFRYRKPDGNGGWIWKLGDTRRVIYRLPEVIEAVRQNRRVYIVEGEKDADRLWSIGLAATCKPGGAKTKWLGTFNPTFTGADVAVIPDHDPPGKEGAEHTVQSIKKSARVVRLLDLSEIWGEIPSKGDVSDWLDHGGSAEALEAAIDRLPAWMPTKPVKPQTEELTEQDVMRMFVENVKGQLRYNHDSKTWLIWRGHRWRSDMKQRVFAMILLFCRDNFPKNKTYQKIRFAEAVEKAARAQHEIATVQQQWDCDPWLLGTPGGIVDLRTGQTRQGKPDDMISKRTACAPAVTAMDCPRWLEFIDYALEGKAENIAFLKRYLGYGLTGSVREETLLYIVGKLGTGKGTLTKTYEGVLGDYAQSVPIAMFTDASWRVEYYRAMLVGYRVIIAAEPEKNSAWSEGFVNELTGGDKLSGRHPSGRPFDFFPTHKPIIHGNSIPELKNVASGLRRRLLIVAFNRAPLVADTTLKDSLRPEYPAILRWLIEGCLEWQNTGLNPPDAVREAVEEYFELQDVLGRWILDCCTVLPTAREKPSILRANYNAWADKNLERRMSANQFHDAINHCRLPHVSQVKIQGNQIIKGLAIKQGDTGGDQEG